MSREAMQLALEALEQLDGIDTETECVTIDVNDVITALRQALEEEREPLYWSVSTGWVYANDTSQVGTSKEVNWTPIYTAPPKKEWVGLTDEEIDEKTDFRGTVRYFEAKLKEKNT